MRAQRRDSLNDVWLSDLASLPLVIEPGLCSSVFLESSDLPPSIKDHRALSFLT